MKKKNYWLYFEPYVHININTNGSIIYNTLNSKYIEFSPNNVVTKLLKEVLLQENLYIIQLNDYELENKEVNNFIKMMREYFIGDIFEKEWSFKKPIQAIPINRIENKIEISKQNEDIKEMENLDEIILFLNSSTDKITNIEKQLNFCSPNFHIEQQIDYEIIKNLFNTLKSCKFVFSGADVFSFTFFEDFVKEILNNNLNTTFNINYLNKNLNTNRIKLIEDTNIIINIFVSTPINENVLKEVIKILDKFRITYFIEFIVEKSNDIDIFENIINKLNIGHYSFIPFYNGENIDLFKNAVFQNKEDILNSEITIQNLLARQEINQHDFGKLYITTNADVYANLNKQKLGNLKKNKIYELIRKELCSKNSWRLLRKDVKPCKSCVYNLLCPSISNYELVIGKNNLCHVWED